MTPLLLAFLIDPPEKLDPPTDTTLAIMREGCRRGHRVVYATLGELRLADGRPQARVRPVRFSAGRELFTAGKPRELDLAACDALFMRKDPPVDEAYLHATYILDRLPPGVLQVNPAAALRNHCEKLIPLHFPDLTPETLVSRRPEELAAFLERMERIVVKPLDDCSGRGIFTLSPQDPNRRSLLEEVTAGGRRFVMGQRFLAQITEGEKRVLLLGEEILGYLKRVPAAGDFRSNVNAGGHCVPCELEEDERAACVRVGAWLAERGVHLAGLDLVGGHLLEVNITSPSCLREMNQLTGQALEERVLDYLESRCHGRTGD